MENILFLSSTEADGSLSRAALEALGAARSLADGLGAKLSAAVFGASTAAAAAQVAGAPQRLLAAEGPDLAEARYASDAAAATALARAAEATIVVAPHTSRMARIMAGVAHRLGGKVDTHATGLAAAGGAPAVTRWFYRQRMEATLTRPQRPWVVLLDAGCAQAWAAQGAAPSAEQVAVALDDKTRRTRVTGLRSPQSGKQTIRPDAKVLFVAGAGWGKKQPDGKPHVEEAERLILDFLDVSKASLGSSKSLVDQAGEGGAIMTFMSHLNQVGQTGATPRHPKGLATCCHGEEPHVVGWRFITERRAVNLDPNCGWARGKADVLYVADAFEVMSKVNALLRSRG
ncbi:MAG TPA: electron transfer flavoprotein subunit alpha [Anaeromyxobacteraceae bacterium]|nr:electron transfer flavoprotein subunit alpha [Anaeromyxobacteraceae bacterium]